MWLPKNIKSVAEVVEKQSDVVKSKKKNKIKKDSSKTIINAEE